MFSRTGNPVKKKSRRKRTPALSVLSLPLRLTELADGLGLRDIPSEFAGIHPEQSVPPLDLIQPVKGIVIEFSFFFNIGLFPFLG
jgi:hypothetical protein